jgi:hypothetical protein
MLALMAAAQAGPAPMQVRRQVTIDVPDVAVTGTCAARPLDMSGPIPVVDVMVNGKGPYRFGIDTGAQGVGRISSDLATQLGLKVAGEARTPAPGGTIDTRNIYRADTLGVGGIGFAGVDLVAMPALPGRPITWSGILGIDLFRKLTLTLDYGRSALKLSHDPVTDGVAANFDHGVPSIPLKIGDREITADLDTGNGAAPLFVSEAIAKAVPLSGPAVERGKARTSFGEFSIMEGPISVPVTIGGTALPVHAIGWPSARGEANLGSHGLAGMQLSVDHVSGRVAIRPSDKAPSCS